MRKSIHTANDFTTISMTFCFHLFKDLVQMYFLTTKLAEGIMTKLI